VEKNHPNILFIMADQMRFDCIGCNGNTIIKTPSLDSLAEKSAIFSSFFIQAPVCVPSRQTFFTGRYPRSHKNRVNYTEMNDDVTLIQKRLQNNGYKTGFVGKLHYFPPTMEYALTTGFDHGFIHDAGPTDSYSDYIKWIKSLKNSFSEENYRKCKKGTENPYITKLPSELHETTWCGEKTRELMKKMSRNEEPFFLFSSYWKPHSPFEVPEPWATMYDNEEIMIPDEVSEEYINSLPEPVRKLAYREGKKYFKTGSEEILWKYRAYYGAVSQIDHEVGLTLELLKELGLEENTLVVFCSDHGDMLYGHGLIDKNFFFDEAIHTPFMISYPGIIEPGNYNELTESTDVLSTIFELCGLEVPYDNQGRSFAGLITKSDNVSKYIQREFVYAENIIPEVITNEYIDYRYKKDKGIKGIRHPDAKMIRSRKWKYNYYIDSEELFDLENDPGETENLAYLQDYRDVVQKLRKKLLDWMITADESDQIAPGWFSVKSDKGDWEIWDKWK